MNNVFLGWRQQIIPHLPINIQRKKKKKKTFHKKKWFELLEINFKEWNHILGWRIFELFFYCINEIWYDERKSAIMIYL